MKAEAARSAVGLRVVIDTNIWISAALVRDGTPARLVRHVLEHGLPVFSTSTFTELETRLWRPKFDRYLGMEVRQRILHDLNAAGFWIEPSPRIAAQRHCRDADDDKFIHAALAAPAAWLVTGDHDLLDVPPLPGLSILSPADALRAPGFCV